MNQQRNYTLIELLTVIGVIAILAGLIMPAVSVGIQRAKRTKCASNLKQVGSMIMLFSSDRNGSLPLYERSADYTTYAKTIEKASRSASGAYANIEDASASSTQKKYWTAGLLRYAKYDMSIFYCPSDEDRALNLFPSNPNDMDSSYSLNYGDANRPGGASNATSYVNISSATRSAGAIVLVGETCEGKLGMNTLDTKILNPTFKVPAAHVPHRKYLNMAYLDGHVDPIHDNSVPTLADQGTTDHPNSIFKMQAKKDD